MIKKHSATSDIRDIIHLHQNLHTLGGLAIESGQPINADPLKTVLDKVTLKHLELANLNSIR